MYTGVQYNGNTQHTQETTVTILYTTQYRQHISIHIQSHLQVNQ